MTKELTIQWLTKEGLIALEVELCKMWRGDVAVGM